MPQLIQHIDAIARAKQRAVLFVKFHSNISEAIEWETLPIRAQIISWLDANFIKWERCAHIASTDFMMSYRGQIYIDVPFAEDDPRYQKLRDYLEHSDGSMAFEGMYFCAMTLENAMKNAHHDKPGFWDNFAENW